MIFLALICFVVWLAWSFIWINVMLDSENPLLAAGCIGMILLPIALLVQFGVIR